MSRKDTIPSPDRIPGFTLNYRIGQGGMGVVFHATQNSLHRPVAIKVLTSRLSEEPAMVARFEREAEALGRLNHPNIVRVFERGVARGGLHYFAMEHVDGPSLRSLMRRHDALSREDFRRMIHEVCDALQYIHGQGIVHRDIKPGNILRDAAGRFRITDFGLIHVVKNASAGSTSTMPAGAKGSRSGGASVVGTPMYLAPEQLHPSERVTPAADIYSLAVVCYELIAGALPLGRFKAPSELNHTSTPALDAPLLKALNRDAADRPATVRDFERAMLQAIDSSPKLRLRQSKRAVEEGSSAVDKADLNLARGASSRGRFDGRAVDRARQRAIAYGAFGTLLALLCAVAWIAWPEAAPPPSLQPAKPAGEQVAWAANFPDAVRAAAKSNRPIFLALTEGADGARDIVLGPAGREIVESSFVAALADLARNPALRDRFTPSSLPRALALDATGRTVVLESVWPILQEGGVAGFLHRALEAAKPFNAWGADLDEALARARASGDKPILLLASCGHAKDQLRDFKTRIASDPMLAEACSGMLLLSLEEEADEAVVTSEYGLISFPVLALIDSTENRMIDEEPMRFPPPGDEEFLAWLRGASGAPEDGDPTP